jgi:hypothetical protein
MFFFFVFCVLGAGGNAVKESNQPQERAPSSCGCKLHWYVTIVPS